jgi:hypothetical protein
MIASKWIPDTRRSIFLGDESTTRVFLLVNRLVQHDFTVQLHVLILEELLARYSLYFLDVHMELRIIREKVLGMSSCY